jgi:DNA-binding phage protein
MKPNIKLETYKIGEIILKKNFLGKAIAECLINNDPEGVIEVISIYLDAINKTKLTKNASMQRSTLYQALKGKNPTIKRLAKVIHNAIESVK